MNYLDRLAHWSQQRGDAAAIDGECGAINHASLHALVIAGAVFLREAGIGSASVVGVHLADEVDHLLASLSLLALGATQITLATHDTKQLSTEIATRVKASHVVTAGGVDWPAQAVMWQRPSQADAPADFQRSESGCILLKTSGTTGTVNILEFSEELMALQSERHPEYASERLLRLASIEHNNSKRHRLYCVWNGGVNVFRPHGTFAVLDYVEAHRVTCLDISRMHASDLAATPGAARLANVKVRTGGSAIPWPVRREVQEKVSRHVYVRYAATECGAIAMAMPDDHDADESSGLPLPGVQFEVIDADSQPVPAGSSGIVRLRAPGMAAGYYDNPAQTQERFRDGWFYPGDLARLRADGQVVVEGRVDDMIVMNGLNIFPGEIERVLQSHPAVASAAALPIESRVHGQIPVAVVELRPGQTATPIELQRHGREALALRAPRKVVVVPALPRNSQGKIVKRGLERLFNKEKT